MTQIGEKNHKAKLTEIDVGKIRELHTVSNVSTAELSRRFNVHPKTIYMILERKRWKHVIQKTTT